MPTKQFSRTSRFSSSVGRPGRRGPYNQSSRSGRPAGKSKKQAKEYIHPSRFIKPAVPVSADDFVPLHSFSDFPVVPLLHQNVAAMGYTQPSPIQDQAIPLALAGRDVVGVANTGTGKTAAFAIPILQRLITEPKSKLLIMAPTRELAQQIEQQCRLLGKGSGLYGALLIGGVAMGPQLKALRDNPRIIIGTPGRIKDHLERGTLNISDCNLVVLDEVDRMLDMGFVHDMRKILSLVKDQRQNLYFSATLDERVRGIIETFSRDPVTVQVRSQETSSNVEQDIVPYADSDSKVEILHDLLIRDETAKTIIFDDTQRSVERLSKLLMTRGFLAGSIHGGKSQAQRQRILRQFKDSDINVLVATDVAARGLDIDGITHVINYSQPQSYQDYIHRIGRTGRAGKSGVAYTFVEAK